MRKVLLHTGMLWMLATSAVAQSFVYYRGGQPLEDNATYTVSSYQIFLEEDDYVILSLESDLYLKNVTNRDVQATVTQTILEEPLDDENGYLNFCFYDCSTGNANRTKTGVLLADRFNEGFHVNFYAFEGKFNRISVRYEVYSTNDISRSDKKTVTVVYEYDETSIPQNNSSVVKPDIHVVQEGDQMKFIHAFISEACQLDVYSLSGQQVAHHCLPSGNGSFALPEHLAKGVYFYTIRDEIQTVFTQKFIVR